MPGGLWPLLRRWQTGLTVAPGDWGSLYLLAWLEGILDCQWKESHVSDVGQTELQARQ